MPDQYGHERARIQPHRRSRRAIDRWEIPTTTGMPGKRQASPRDALQFLNDVRQRLTLITRDETEYLEVLDAAAESGTAGGAIYDALIARCAMKAKAQVLYTWNTKHFMRLKPELAAHVREPQPA
jgi:predicted nucleic acid-binding protein